MWVSALLTTNGPNSITKGRKGKTSITITTCFQVTYMIANCCHTLLFNGLLKSFCHCMESMHFHYCDIGISNSTDLKINNNLITALSVTIFGYKKNSNNNNNNHHHHHFLKDNYNGHSNTYVICYNSNFIMYLYKYLQVLIKKSYEIVC